MNVGNGTASAGTTQVTEKEKCVHGERYLGNKIILEVELEGTVIVSSSTYVGALLTSRKVTESP